ncbi:MAG: alpha/beta hydrolase [Bacteroidetes bacterium]|nr:MAG: alpha/beta hydrolase [Bacteroidota bacterium]TAG86419.1 MAG: alpha/beta hydrolase [Bacteroidota bacterium]
MALNWKLNLLLKANNLINPLPDLNKISATEFRKYNEKGYKKLFPLVEYKPLKLYEIKDCFFENENQKIPLRIYKPTIQRKLPILMFFHAGGFVVGNLETHDKLCRRLAKLSNCIVIAVDYRLAPEYKFPMAHYDCYEATQWAFENAHTFGGNPLQIAVCGDSAGGNLATGVCMLAKEKANFQISYQVLLYPCTDGKLSMPSIQTLEKGYVLTKEIMEYFLKCYKNPQYPITHHLFSPMYAQNLENLPPALIITGEFDPLKDEGRKYAENLSKAGVKVVFQECKGMIHLFLQMPKLLKTARKTLKMIGETLKTEFGMNGRL